MAGLNEAIFWFQAFPVISLEWVTSIRMFDLILNALSRGCLEFRGYFLINHLFLLSTRVQYRPSNV